MTLSNDRYLETLRTETERLAAAAVKDLTVRVPSCPEWSVGDLVRHVAAVHAFWNDVAARRLQDPEQVVRPVEPPDETLVAFLLDGCERLVATLREADLEAPMWSWSSVKRVEFVPRRMAQETAVHRWDAQNALGHVTAIEPDVAADGIDEFLTIFLPAEESAPPATGTLGLKAIDTEDSWVLELGPGGIRTERDDARQADATISGAASPLLLSLWRRDGGRTSFEGDAGFAEQVLGWADLT